MNNINLTNNEIWKIIDAIKAYKKDYAVSVSVEKTLSVVVTKLTKAINQ